MSQAPADPFFPAEKYKLANRTITGKDGKKRTEKRPIQKSVLALHPDGSVVWFVLYAGPAQLAENDPYRMAIVYSKQKTGFLFLARCPQMEGYDTQQHLPDEVRSRKPCTHGAKGGEISDADPCRCILETQVIRAAEQRRKTERLNSNDQARAAAKVAEQQAEQLAETKKQNALLIDLATAPKNKGKASE